MRYLVFVLFLVSLSYLIALDTGSYLQGRVLVSIKEDFSSRLSVSSGATGIPELDAKLRSLGITTIEKRYNPLIRNRYANQLSRILELGFDPSISPLGIVNALSREPVIDWTEAIYIDQIFAVPNDPRYPTSLNFVSMQAEAAWDIHKCEDGTQDVIIAIVDTGTSWMHPDLAPNIWNNLGEDANSNGYTLYFNGSTWVMDTGDINGIDDDGNGKVDDLIGWDFMSNTLGDEANNPSDASGHGTIVSGLAGARTNNSVGVASLSWNPILLPISCSYAGQPSSIFRGYDAIIYAAEQGADVINCSWGGNTYSQAAQIAVNYAYSLGAIIVAAAGNSNNTVPVYPAAYQNVVAVASLANDGTKWSSSSFGGFIDVGAPNQNAESTSGTASYTTISGTTSYASPIGSALTALIRSYHPDWTQEQVINQLKASCDDIDLMNPGKENLLGEGKLNAYRALTDIDSVVDQELHLGLFSVGTPNDTNNNRAIEPSESFSLDLRLRNYAWGVAAGTANFTLSTTNPNVTIVNNSYSRDIPADDWFDLDDAFLVTVSPTVTSQYVSFNLSITADQTIASGASLTFQVLIQNGGVFVWEGIAGGRDMSGAFIRSTLQGLGYQVTYGTTFPASFRSFEAVFLSYGNPGSNVVRFATPQMYLAVKEYLLEGGRLYIEGGDAVGFDPGYFLPDIEGGQDANEILWPLLGISSATDGATNSINGLVGESSLPTAGMLFGSSTQTNMSSIDTFEPLRAQSRTAFVESEYGNVAIISAGGYDQRSFVFSYALRELVDGVFPSTRSNLIAQIMAFFEAEDVTLPVELSSFTAVLDNQPLLIWTTSSEIELMGFNVYCAPLADLSSATKINPLIIQAAGTSSESHSYSYRDYADYSVDELYYWLEAVSYDGTSSFHGSIHLSLATDGVPQNPPPQNLVTDFTAAYPNPFSVQIRLDYSTDRKSSIEWTIYNVKGQVVYSSNNERDAGVYRQDLDLDFLPSGLYIMVMRSPQKIATRKLLKL